MTKQEIRDHLRQVRRTAYDAASLDAMSQEATGRLERHPLFRQSRRLLLFHSLPDEVNTHELINRHWREKTILLPVVTGDDITLRVFDGRCEEGKFGICEPVGAVFTDYRSIDLAVIPGVAFDGDRNRLGRGKGYYDRFLPLLRCHTIGLCYPFQLIEHIPTEPHDIKVNEVIS
ncbi:MAG: 5-formyltetrahydrofolate cyclo-ligase [Bacteroidaceae bacterium]|nr:5-formyltetrahydrofolate cyclo-ligase [Bacteroidaceae bacterium]